MRSASALLTAVVLLALPAGAEAHTISKRDMERAVRSHVNVIAPDIPALSQTAVAKVTGVRSSCRRARGSGRHRHSATCRVSVSVRDRQGVTHVATRVCKDRSVRLTVPRKGRLGVVARTARLICRLSGTQPTPALVTPASPVESVPPPGDDRVMLPAPDLVPPAGGLPPGAPPPGPPPGVTATARTADAGYARASRTEGPTARVAQAWPRPSYGFVGCLWRQISGWWIYDCYWRSGSSAPAGAHIIGWASVYYYERYYWGYDSAGNVGVLPWYYGYFEY